MPKVGDKIIFEKIITPETIALFASLVEDFNPMHTGDDFPGKDLIEKRLGISGPIAHGMFTASLICRPLWKLGGNGAIFGEMGKIRFKRPVQVGDRIKVELKVKEVKRSRLLLNVRYINQRDEDVIEPTEAVLFSSKEEEQK